MVFQKCRGKIISNYCLTQLKSIGNEQENQRQSSSNFKNSAWSKQESIEEEIADFPIGDKQQLVLYQLSKFFRVHCSLDSLKKVHFCL